MHNWERRYVGHFETIYEANGIILTNVEVTCGTINEFHCCLDNWITLQHVALADMNPNYVECLNRMETAVEVTD